MNILYYECFAGISGDMNLAAMIDLGVPPEFLRTELSKLGLDHEFDVQVTAASRQGICGTRVDVVLKNQPEGHVHEEQASIHGQTQTHHHGDGDGHTHDHVHEHEHTHEHAHTHEHEHHHEHDDEHGHEHEHAHTHTHEHGHEHKHDHGHTHGAHRNLADITEIIEGSRLDPEVKKTSLRIFRKVAMAESHVHGKPLDEVHFHEVGATDSIVDIVGAAICFQYLGVDSVWSSSVELGGGFIQCAHGNIPVPAPATLEILHGVPTTRGATRKEATTPTGAAILAALVENFTDTPSLVTEKTAYGIGHREVNIPNILRVQLARPVSTGETVQSACLLTCNIDDMTAEMLGVAMDILMDQGAMDVHFTPIIMKKNRPATSLSLLCSVADEARFKDLLFRHTSTLGIKSFPLTKTELKRSFERLETPFGPVTMKNAYRNDEMIRSKPELEDCRRLAEKHDIPLVEVYDSIARLKG
ncbi:nickel pincer cofactor biosynthesis protein LarC [Pseudodesulfovibrio sp. JC047]|uniref:nickel pincer cofactor biosynthesis protein LarC n=1 Tax=Pseudodesulfovibrio sp. JC047 TaxID=2683199 RepID=UPI0013D1B497|nr:nickel pincer cofactor biosynthesis protein LarC [Pseudodesulfovibrio sp. JC047]NDV19453.1 nickel pincer cofactor biosynthesis protein LarC [Pseudodesulfovibrio sp. JC047]